jgi:hypothetical protein
VCNKRLCGGLGVIDAMDLHRDRYRRWGDVTKISFETWWKEHRELFIEEPSVQDLSGDKIERREKHLYLAINLTKPAYKLIPQIQDRITRLQQAGGYLQDGHKRKSKRQAQFPYDERTEIHLPTFREQYRFFKYVYIPELYPPGSYRDWRDRPMDSLGAGQKLWEATAKYYRGKKKPKYLRFSSDLTPVQRQTALRNLRRYVHRINSLCEHVAHGQFP